MLGLVAAKSRGLPAQHLGPLGAEVVAMQQELDCKCCCTVPRAHFSFLPVTPRQHRAYRISRCRNKAYTSNRLPIFPVFGKV